MMIGGSARSIRLVVGIGSIFCWCLYVSVCYPSGSAIYPYNSAIISICIYKIADTIFVVFVVDVDVSSCSIYLILFRRFSIL